MTVVHMDCPHYPAALVDEARAWLRACDPSYCPEEIWGDRGGVAALRSVSRLFPGGLAAFYAESLRLDLAYGEGVAA